MFVWAFSQNKNRSPAWYIIAIIITLSLVIYGIVTGLYLMSGVILLFVGVFLLIENNSLDVTSVTIDNQEISINDTKYSFKEFESFAIVPVASEVYFLRFFPKKRFSNRLEIPISDEINIAQLTEFLS